MQEREIGMLETVYVAHKTFEELMTLFLCDINDDDDYYDVIAYRLASRYRCQLESMLHLLSPKRLRAGISGIGMVGSRDSDGVIQPYLMHDDPMVVSASLDALRLTGGCGWEHVSSLMSHQSHFVRRSTTICKEQTWEGFAFATDGCFERRSRDS